MGRNDEMRAGAYPVIHASDLSTPDARRSRTVSNDEFQRIAGEGEQIHRRLASKTSEPTGLERNWEGIVSHAYEATRQPWGGVTVNSHTGKDINPRANRLAVTAKDPGMDSVHVHPSAGPDEFGHAMKQAKEQFHDVLSRAHHALGVFHDQDTGTIDIDPVYVTNRRRLGKVSRLGAFTGAAGGAYHFKSGLGYWPPHVED